MTPILCIETTGDTCSVALFDGDILLSEMEHRQPNAHASVLFNLIDDAIRSAGIGMNDLKGVCISKGPGSYTGLRIGVAAAKGICHATGAPLMAISTLQLMTESIQTEDHTHALVPMLDARRNEVYTGVYDGLGNEMIAPHPLILSSHSYQEILEKGKVIFLGNGASKWQEQCEHPNAFFQPEIEPLAKNMGRLAYRMFQEQKFEDLAYFEPEYVKPVFIMSN